MTLAIVCGRNCQTQFSLSRKISSAAVFVRERGKLGRRGDNRPQTAVASASPLSIAGILVSRSMRRDADHAHHLCNGGN